MKIIENFNEFGDRYCNPRPSKYHKGNDYNGASNQNEFFYLLNQFVWKSVDFYQNKKNTKLELK